VSPRRDPYAFLATAARYVEAFRPHAHVLKVSGALLERPAARESLLDQCAVLHRLGLRFVLVHGGGAQIDERCRALGLGTEKIDGRRPTTPEVLAVLGEVYAAIRTSLLRGLGERGIPADGALAATMGFRARRRPPLVSAGRSLDFGEVGDLESVDPAPLATALAAGRLVVLSPLCAGGERGLLNVNADTVATAAARALGAAKLVFLLGVPGLLRDPGRPETLLHFGDRKDLEDLVARGACRDGMAVKARAMLEALDGGVRALHLVDGTDPHALLREILTNEGAGTMLVADRAAYRPEAP
jgi:acetylglutamate kinase